MSKFREKNLGDIVAIHEDDVQLTGSGYATFKIIKIKGYSMAKFRGVMSVLDGTEKGKYSHNILVTSQEVVDLDGSDTIKQSQILTNKLKKND